LRTKLIVIVAGLLLLGLVSNPIAIATSLPEGEGVQQLPPGEAFGRQPEYLWIWQYMWPSKPHPEISTGTWIRWGFGWGSTTEQTLIDLLDGLDMEFSIDGKEVNNPKRYFGSPRKMDGYWSLSFSYRHPPFPPGEHSWIVSLSGSVPSVTINGAFTIIKRTGS